MEELETLHDQITRLKTENEALRERCHRYKLRAKRTLAEEALNRSRWEGEREFLRQVIDAVPAFISVKDSEGRFELANKSLAKAWGTTADRIIGRRLADLNPNEEDALCTQTDDLDVIRSRREKFTPEEKVTLSDKSVQWLSVHKVPLSNGEGICDRVVTVGTDITHLKKSDKEKKKLQKQLLQVQKMEAIGTLAGGIAHDFNNILMGVQGHISLLLYDLKPEHPHREKLENIESYIRRGAELTKQILGFAQGGKYDVKPTDINELLGKSVELFGRTRKEIGIGKQFDNHLWSVDVDQGQMDQVFLNLFINASQAMPGGGTIRIETKEGEGEFLVSVADTGPGIPEGVLEHLFTPFYTTKRVGKGTGLGLSVCYGIVKMHGGWIRGRNRAEGGACFEIGLRDPAAAPGAAVGAERPAS